MEVFKINAMKTIHINCDLGEGGDNDKDLMPLISACNIACGGHAGTVESMKETVALALKNNVEIGAHPSYPDKENFGRRSLKIAPEELKRSLVAQILSLKHITESEGGKLTHVKPHGALYNDAAKDTKIAQIILDSLKEFDQNLKIYTPENSALSSLAQRDFLLVYEAFADRNYNPDFSLVSREKEGALLIKKEEVWDHVFLMISEGKILCKNGEKIPVIADTFCLHSDTPNAVEILQFLHEKFAQNNIKIARS